MSKQINDGGPAYPVGKSIYPSGNLLFDSPGMSLRAYLAGQALAGEMIHPEQWTYENRRLCAERCVAFADALIAELEKEAK